MGACLTSKVRVTLDCFECADIIQDSDLRDHNILTGFAAENASIYDLPEDLFSWMWQRGQMTERCFTLSRVLTVSVAFTEPRDELARAYIGTLKVSPCQYTYEACKSNLCRRRANILYTSFSTLVNSSRYLKY